MRKHDGEGMRGKRERERKRINYYPLVTQRCMIQRASFKCIVFTSPGPPGVHVHARASVRHRGESTQGEEADGANPVSSGII